MTNLNAWFLQVSHLEVTFAGENGGLHAVKDVRQLLAAAAT